MFPRLFVLSLLTLSSPTLISGCGKKSSTTAAATEGKVGSLDFKAVQSGVTFEGTSIKGTGDVVAKNPLAATKTDGKNIALTFSIEDGGSVTLKAFSSATLENGINVVFTRSGSTLKVKTTSGQTSSTEKSLTLIPSSAVSVLVDVHNDESPAHILVWNGTEATPTESNALFDTKKDGDAAGQGAENFWGLSLSNATVTSAALADVKFED